MTPLLEQNDRVCLQWPVNILTKEPDSIRLCKKAWIACLSPLLTTPVYDAVEACNFYDEDSTIATIDDALLADCGNLLRAKAIQLVREILTTSDAQWSIKYIRIVYEISQLQAAADQHLALDMARMGLGALGTGGCFFIYKCCSFVPFPPFLKPRDWILDLFQFPTFLDDSFMNTQLFSIHFEVAVCMITIHMH